MVSRRYPAWRDGGVRGAGGRGCEPKLWDRVDASPLLPGLTRQPGLQRQGVGCRNASGTDGEGTPLGHCFWPVRRRPRITAPTGRRTRKPRHGGPRNINHDLRCIDLASRGWPASAVNDGERQMPSSPHPVILDHRLILARSPWRAGSPITSSACRASRHPAATRRFHRR